MEVLTVQMHMRQSPAQKDEGGGDRGHLNSFTATVPWGPRDHPY